MSQLIAQIDSAMDGISRLTGYGEDAVWRPANKAWCALRDARKALLGESADDLSRADDELYASGEGRPGVASGNDARTPDVGSIADISARALRFENEQDRVDYWNKMIGPIPSWERPVMTTESFDLCTSCDGVGERDDWRCQNCDGTGMVPLGDWRASDEDEDYDEADSCCPGCGACPGFTGVECDETCEWAKADALRDPPRDQQVVSDQSRADP